MNLHAHYLIFATIGLYRLDWLSQLCD